MAVKSSRSRRNEFLDFRATKYIIENVKPISPQVGQDILMRLAVTGQSQGSVISNFLFQMHAEIVVNAQAFGVQRRA